jgi:hypothetical protein
MANFIIYASLRTAWPLIQQYLRDPVAPFAIRLKQPDSVHAVFNYWHEDATNNTKYNTCCYKYFTLNLTTAMDDFTDLIMEFRSRQRIVVARCWFGNTSCVPPSPPMRKLGSNNRLEGNHKNQLFRLVICGHAQNRTNKLQPLLSLSKDGLPASNASPPLLYE